MAANPEALILLSGLCSLAAMPVVSIYLSFTKKYRNAYRAAPIPGFHTKFQGDHDGNLYVGRQALRNTILTENFDGLSGVRGMRRQRDVREVQAGGIRIRLV